MSTVIYQVYYIYYYMPVLIFLEDYSIAAHRVRSKFFGLSFKEGPI